LNNLLDGLGVSTDACNNQMSSRGSRPHLQVFVANEPSAREWDTVSVSVSLLSRFEEDRERHGLRLTAYAWALRLSRRLTGFKRLECLQLLCLKPEALSTPQQQAYDKLLFRKPSFECRPVTRCELEVATAQLDNELDPEFIREALEKGHDCFGVFDNARLVSYAWCSAGVTTFLDGYSATFPPNFIYLYKAFTHPDYRGMGLNRMAVRSAASNYLKLGFTGLLCNVYADNLSSLKSFRGMGFEWFGDASYFRPGARVYHSRGCRELGFQLAAENAEKASSSKKTFRRSA
jgi:ribosomal protein S18 acetylase RimI-like enzyme